MPPSENLGFRWQRALITGASGFLGQHLLAYLRRLEVSVEAIGRGEHADRFAGKGPGGDNTVVFHLAGSADVGYSIAHPMADFQANVVATLQVLDWARNHGAAVLFPSTGSVYDPSGPRPFSESARIRPSSPYGAAKLAGEAYCQAYASSYGVDARVARIFSVYGPGMRRFAIRDFHERLSAQPTVLQVRGSGRQTRDYLYVSDAVRALAAIMADGTPGGIYNVASGKPRSMAEVAQTVASAMGLDHTRLEYEGEESPSEVKHMEASVDKLLQLGFRPEVGFSQGIHLTVQSFNNRKRA